MLNPGLQCAGTIKEVIQPVEVPVAAFPLRGKCNPYCGYLLPLLLLRVLIFLSLLGALISAVIIPRDLDFYNLQTPNDFISTRIAAIIIFGIAISFTITTFLVELLNCCNIADSRFVSILISFLDLLFALAVLGVSIPLIVREAQLQVTYPGLFTLAIDQNTFLAAGILGVTAVLFYLVHLFVSRFYQFCIGNYKNFKREFLAGSVPYTTCGAPSALY